MGVPGVVNKDGKAATGPSIGGAAAAAEKNPLLLALKGPGGPDFPSMVAEFVKSLSVPSAPEPTAQGIAAPPGLRDAQLQAQTLGTLQLSGGPVNTLILPDF